MLGANSLCFGNPQTWGTKEAEIRPLAVGNLSRLGQEETMFHPSTECLPLLKQDQENLVTG